MLNTIYAVVLVGVQSKKEVTVTFARDEDTALAISRQIQEFQKEKSMEISIVEYDNGQYALMFIGGESKKTITVAIVKDVKVVEAIASEVQSLQTEGGFTISIFELEKKEEQPNGHDA